MREMRDWAASYLAAAATVVNVKRTVGNRSKIAWRDLPTRRGFPVKMSPEHGHVYQALVAHSGRQDYEDDSIVSDASVDQLARQCYWSPSSVTNILADLRAVGLISTQGRQNKSSLTTVYRTAGNFGGATEPGDAEVGQSAFDEDDFDSTSVTLPAVDAADAPGLASRIATALNDAGLPIGDLTVEEMKAHITKTQLVWESNILFNRPGVAYALEMVPGCDERHFEVIERVLPRDRALAVYSSIGQGSAWAILKRPEEIARALLAEACGKSVDFGGFPGAVRSHRALPIYLANSIRESSKEYGHVWRGIAAANNPAAYLQKAVADLLAKYDEGLDDGSENEALPQEEDD